MPKSAIINIARPGMIEEVQFKKLSLFFDRLYIDWKDLWFAERDIKESKKLTEEEKSNLLMELDWLKEQGLIQTYTFGPKDLKDLKMNVELEEDIKMLNEDIQVHLIPATPEEKQEMAQPGQLQFAGVVAATNELIFKMEDMRMRIDAVRLGVNEPATQFVPIVNSFDSYCTKKSPDMALHFILGKIPVPDEHTAWEQILEFRSDTTVQRKYHALLNWINEAGRQDMPLPHLVDKYNQLYSEYLHQYSLHKLTSGYTMLEMLVLGGIDFISALLQQNFTAAFKGLLTIRKEQVGLLRAEKDIEGRELGYIFSANEKFKP